MATTRENGRQRYWRQVRQLAEEHDIPVSDAREMWRRHYKPGGIKRIRLAVNRLTHKITGTSVSICPFCRDDLVEGELAYLCGGCATTFHEECFQEFGGKCTTLGCTGRGSQKPRINTPLVIHVESRARWPRYLLLGLSVATVIISLLIWLL